MKKIWIVGISVVVGFGILLKNPRMVSSTGSIYDKIDKIVETNKPKAKRLYNVLGDLQEYIGEKLGKKQKGVVDFSDIYGFNLSYILGEKLFSMSVVDKKIIEGLDLSNYGPELSHYYLRTVWLKIKNDIKLFLMKPDKNRIDPYISKYNKIINDEIKLNSKKFEQIKTHGKTRNNVLNIRHGFAQISPINPHFIKNRDGKIKGIAFYVFEGNGNIASMDLHYKIYSIRDNAMMEVDINMIEPENTEKGEWSDELIVDKSIDTEKFQEKYFKTGYYNGVGQEDEWQKRKEKIEYFENVVRES